MFKNHIGLLLLFVMMSIVVHAQKRATYFDTATTKRYVTPLQSRANSLVLSIPSTRKIGDKMALRPQVIPGKDPQREDDFFVRNKQTAEQSRSANPPLLVFDSVSQESFPNDPSIAVGPDHVVVVYNTGFRIFDKQGNPLTDQLDEGNIFTDNTACCDPTVSYDNAADRWVMSILYDDLWGSNFDGIQIAVSDGPNPLTDGWNVYQFNMNVHAQKLSVWSDGYYMTSSSAEPEKIHAFERDEMLAGGDSPQIVGFDLPGAVINGFLNPQALNVTDSNLPESGGATFIMMQDDTYAGINTDHLKLWTVDVDWDTVSNSTITIEPEIPLTPFISVFDGGGTFDNLVQPGGQALDANYGFIMNQAQFRKFDTHNSAVFNFVVDANAGAGKLAAVRWIELRQDQDNDPWSLYQEGTYTAPNGKHAWCASIAMDGNGNIGLGYTSMSGPTTPETVRVGSYFSGRMSDDPLGTMTIAEELIASGNSDFNQNNRYGDYSKIDVDPSDDLTFWFQTEYMNPTRKNVVGAFKLDEELSIDDNEIDQSTILVTSSDQRHFDISLKSSFDNLASISVYNLQGQRLASNFLEKNGDGYNYKLDMSYAAKGIYLVKIGDPTTATYKTAKILVK